MQVFLLDERYHRAVKPCYLRKVFCEKVSTINAMDPLDACNAIYCVGYFQQSILAVRSHPFSLFLSLFGASRAAILRPPPIFCRGKLLDDLDNGRNATERTVWCEDFLRGGHDGTGSCCAYDEEVAFGW